MFRERRVRVSDRDAPAEAAEQPHEEPASSEAAAEAPETLIEAAAEAAEYPHEETTPASTEAAASCIQEQEEEGSGEQHAEDLGSDKGV
jgi:hypothetical protein